VRTGMIHGVFIAAIVFIFSAAIFVYFNSTTVIPGKIIVPEEEKKQLDQMIDREIEEKIQTVKSYTSFDN